MSAPKIDPRLEGKSVSQITDKFVRENATEEELSKIYKTSVERVRDDTIYLGGCSLEHTEVFLEKIRSYMRENAGSYIEGIYDGDEATVRYVHEEESTVAPIDYLKASWTLQIREYCVYQKEYNEWLRLNDKFGEEL